MTLWRKGMIGAAWLALAMGAAADPIPYTSLPGAGATPSFNAPLPAYSSESQKLHDAVEAAKSGDVARAAMIQSMLADPVARRIVTWAEIDSAGTMLSFYELDSDSRDLTGWPRGNRRRAVAEKQMEAAAVPPSQTIAWFAARPPETPEGAMALASAYQAQGRAAEAQSLIRDWWRNHVFEVDVQSRMRARFAAVLTQDDDNARLSALLYGSQGPAARAMVGLASADRQALAEARIALRADRSNAPQLVDLVPPALQSDPGLAFDRARFYLKHNLDVLAVGQLHAFPTVIPVNPEVQGFIWTTRRALLNAALRNGDMQGAYAAVTNTGLSAGTDYAEAEFFAGWIALTKLHDPQRADQHFALIQTDVSSPISVARAFYWRGRAAQAKGDPQAADAMWRQGAPYYTTFYGQLSAEKIGQHTLSIGTDPAPDAAQRAAFESRDLVRAARMLAEAGEHDLFRAFTLAADEQMTSADQVALLVDMARLYGDQDLSMRVVRSAAQRGIFLPVRGYPVLTTPQAYGSAEPAFMLSIARQESNFDPGARSGVGAQGLMQLMPATASILARRAGIGYSPGILREADYNMRLGGYYLGQLVDQFGGSYPMASAAYNAGPGRPATWVGYCGDPRGGGTDPTDFIECIPFSETRNYVMRTMETMEVYRARLNGGTAPLTLAEDLKRGSWTPSQTPGLPNGLPSNAPTNGPIPYSQLSPAGAAR